jgi:hypothetical protein
MENLKNDFHPYQIQSCTMIIWVYSIYIYMDENHWMNMPLSSNQTLDTQCTQIIKL